MILIKYQFKNKYSLADQAIRLDQVVQKVQRPLGHRGQEPLKYREALEGQEDLEDQEGLVNPG